jgi:L-alanine-DL-glutamate epimerase-like enolase superfamily enzyme
MVPISLTARAERWPIAGTFTISRGAKSEAAVVVAELHDGHHRGRGECVPYARYGESAESVLQTLESLRPQIASGLDRIGLQQALAPGAARNALDCAFWDLEAKRAARPAHEMAGMPPPHPLTTAYTISLAAPHEMASAAANAADRTLLKVKLGGTGDPERIAAVRRAAPSAELIVDANEGWTQQNLTDNIAACAAAGVTLIEQPLPDGDDAVLSAFRHPIPICADESVHTRASLPALARKYDALNIKLDKTGGLTEALATVEDANRLGFSIMVGCMVATSLGIAPAVLLAQQASFVDLDGALLLARDRLYPLRYEGSRVHPPSRALWG